jgi:pimeloyl-ACP methyl ester carboxylesterase
MATFVLVHGAWHGSWCWKRVRKLLQDQGHEVFTPTLTGVAERSHLLSRQVNLETHILDVANLIRWEELTEVVLCGHSYGGAVISGAADRVPDRIRSLVYLDAFVLENGETVVQHAPFGDDQVVDGWKVLPIPAEYFAVNFKDREWVNRQCTIQPIECWRQPISLTGGIEKIRNISYILAEGWASENAGFFRFYGKAKAKGWRTVAIASGHDVMLDQPEELTRELLDASNAGGVRTPKSTLLSHCRGSPGRT